MGHIEYKFGNIVNIAPTNASAINYNDTETVSDIIQSMSETLKELLLIKSHIGMIIQSTTLDTEEKVKAIYGGNTWTKIEGRFLVGVSDSYDVNTTGGNKDSIIPYHNHTVSSFSSGIESATHTHSGTTTTNGYHSHAVYVRRCDAEASNFGLSTSSDGFGDRVSVNSAVTTNTTGGGSHAHTMTTGTESANHTHSIPQHSTKYVGESGNITDANMPPYTTVYIWERTA